MTTKRLGLIMNGVTGRMGLNQHLIRSIIAIRDQGGVLLSNGDRMLPDPILIGRDAEKVERLAKRFNVERWSTDLDKALADKNDTIFFDAATTQARPSLLTKAIEAGKHVYCEKPIATNLDEAVAVLRLAERKGVKHGTVQDKLFLPHAFGARRVWLLGVRGRLAGGAAAVVELPQRGRRRNHSRHGVPLAVRARQSLRRGREHLLSRHDRYPRTFRREGQKVHGDGR
jgi:predicted dehydrogenase